jgi:hypothetical protein
MEEVHIRQQDGHPNLWWVSSPSGDDVAYITHLGKSYFLWTTEPTQADFVGTRFDTVDAALAGWSKAFCPPSWHVRATHTSRMTASQHVWRSDCCFDMGSPGQTLG